MMIRTSQMRKVLLLLSAAGFSVAVHAQTEVELAGKATPHFPFFHYVQNFNADQEVSMAIDAKLYPSIANSSADVYVVYNKSAAEWSVNNSLVDVTNGGQQRLFFPGDSIQQNIFQLASPNDLISYNAIDIGVGYDVVIDVDTNGILSPADFIDGSDGAGFFVLHDLTQPGALAVTTVDWTVDTMLTKRMWYPANIAAMDALPLIVISHGWTYNYTHYDYIGEHLASYGYIVMSHRNDVGNGDPDGTQTASLSLIAAIDHLLAHQDTLFGGVLNGKIDAHRMGWLGHSTGGESPVRAFTRLHNGENSSAYFSWTDVKYISSLCPVSWFPDSVVNPYDVNYHQFIGGADNDVSGMPIDNYCQPMTIYERGTGNKHVIYVHGAGHGVFNTDSLNPYQWVSGPDLINREQLHPIVNAYLLAMSELYCKHNRAGQEFFTRSYSEYHPMNVDTAVVISNECVESQSSGKRVIDDFQSNDSLDLASSNAVVTSNLQNSYEMLMQDFDHTFFYFPARPANGMTRARFTDSPHCLLIEWDSAGYVRYAIPDSIKDFSGYEFLSLRACQRTRHPFNVALDSSINFSISITDEAAHTSSVMIADYGTVIQTYQRSSGWQNEFCTIRIRLSDFLVNGTHLDLTKIEQMEFSFGNPGISSTGALGIDDIELVRKEMNVVTGIGEFHPGETCELLIYPNPFSERVTLRTSRFLKNATCTVYDLQGQVVRQIRNVSGQTIILSRDQLSGGLYFVQLRQENNIVTTGKLIVRD